MLDHPQTRRITTWPVLNVCDLPVSVAGIVETATAMVEYCRGEDRKSGAGPLFLTSVNGQVLSMCASDPDVYQLFAEADLIHCDGQPLVLLSRLMGRLPLPERVATTDLFPATARLASERGVTFYLLGATPEVNRTAIARTRETYPALSIVGSSHGYLSEEEEDAVVADIARLKPDILWVALGAPREQRFVVRHRERLHGVDIVKTAGGLFDFLAARTARAPRWMQTSGLEWLFRLSLEPRRLFLRYLITNPHALFLIVRSLRPSRARPRDA